MHLGRGKSHCLAGASSEASSRRWGLHLSSPAEELMPAGRRLVEFWPAQVRPALPQIFEASSLLKTAVASRWVYAVLL